MFIIDFLSVTLVFMSGLLVHFPIKRLVYHQIYDNIQPIQLFVLTTTNFWKKIKYGLYTNYIIKLNNSYILITRLEQYYNTMDTAMEAKRNFYRTKLYVNPMNPFRAIQDPFVIWRTILVIAVFLVGICGLFRKKLISFSDKLCGLFLLLVNLIVIGTTIYFYSIDFN